MASAITHIRNLLLIGAAAAALGATAAPAASARLLVVVPNSPDAAELIQSSHIKVIASYDAFTLVEATPTQVKQLRAVDGEIRDDMRNVEVNGRWFDPTNAATHFQRKTGDVPRLASRGGNALLLVQYIGPVKPEWAEMVRSTGAGIVTYMANNAHLVVGNTRVLAAVGALAGNGAVRAVVPYGASSKLRPRLAQSGRNQVVISTVAGAAGNAARAEIAHVSVPRGAIVPTGGTVHQRVELNASQHAALAEFGGVVAIEPFFEPEMFDERAALVVANQLDGSFQSTLGDGYLQYLADAGFPATTTPFVADVTDGGIDKGVVPAPAGSNPVFYENGNGAGTSRMAYAQEATAADSDAADCGGHGTNVASIIGGYSSATGATDEDAGGFNYGLGINPFVQLGASKIFRCAGNLYDVSTSITALRSAAYGLGARISNNSWGNSGAYGSYGADSQENDTLVRDAQPGTAGNQQMIIVFSAGNSGANKNFSSLGSPGTGKNVITVGASENTRAIGASDGCSVPDTGANSARDIIYFSSRGPTSDGRIKPDIVAPGTHVTGAQPQTGASYNGSSTCNKAYPAGSTLYNLVSGTSQAAPEVTGFGSLIYGWYKANVPGDAYPSPAMTKAIMVNTATDLAGGDDGYGGVLSPIPNMSQGWGRINLGNVLDGTSRKYFDQASTFASSGQASNHTFKVADANKPVRVSLAWTDAGGPTTGKSYVNDLDLQVTAGGVAYKGNVFSGGLSAAGGAADFRNNVENVFLPAGVKGPVKVSVVAKTIGGDGVPGNADVTDQDYALVVSNVTDAGAAAPILQAGAIKLTPGDSDGALEQKEKFKVSLAVKNVGNANAPSFTGTLTSPTGEATITKAKATWPAIAINKTKVNSTLFQATVKSTQACGKPVHLAVTGKVGVVPFSIPLTLPTGKAGPAKTFTSTDVPKSIPDNSLAGASSTVAVTGAGLLSGITVKIASLTHAYDRDLEFDLVGPDGTTVRLVARQGQDGQDFTNTVFTDAATISIGAGTPPFTGSFNPTEPLSAFVGKPAAGTWTLMLRDREAGDAGTLNGWSITRTMFVCN